MSNASDFVIERGTLEQYTGSDAHVVIPDKVKTIGSYAFRRRNTLRSVTLPESVTKISDNAFRDCIALEEVSLPQKLKTIGAEAFRNCRALHTVEFTGEPEKMGLLAFYGCWKLRQNTPALLEDFFSRMQKGNLTLEEGKKLYRFSKSKGVAAVKEFDGVSMRAWDGTKYPYEFSSEEICLIIPESIGDLPVVKAPSKQLPENAIVYCSADQFDKLPRPNKAILAAQWLMEDKMLREELIGKIQVFIPKYADDVAYALRACEDPEAYRRFLEVAKPKAALIEKLITECRGKAEILAVLLTSGGTSKREPEGLSLDAKPKLSVTELKKLWTYQTYTLAATGEKYIELTNYKGRDKHVEIPAFIGKTKVSVIRTVFPSVVESVDFSSEEIEIKCSFRNCPKMADRNGFVYIHVGGRCVLTDYIGPKDIDVLVIPDGVTENVYGAFRSLQCREVILPDGFVSLAGSSFADCRRLQKVTLPESLRTIGQMAFQDCEALGQLYIPENVTEIGILDFKRANDKSFTIYGTHGSAAHAYAEKYGHSFVEGRPDGARMPDFLIKDGVLTGYVGNGGNLVIPEDVIEIKSFALTENDRIQSLVIGNQVHVIHSYAFASCYNLSSVRIGGQVKTIEDCAFQFSGLRQVEVEEGVETIGESAFGYLSHSGATIKIPSSVCQIGENAFGSDFGSITLYVKAGSYAEAYAKEHNIPFVAE